MVELEFGKKKAAGPHAINVIDDNGHKYFKSTPKYSQHGDSGGPIIYKNPDTGTLSIIGVVGGHEFPYLDETQFNWIKKAGATYADMEQRGDI